MKSKIYNSLLILFSLIGYLEWGKTNHSFLYQVEIEMLSKLMTDPRSIIHPLTILPLIGQILLLATLFQKKPNKTWTYIGIGCIGLLLILMFLIGLISLNYKITLSTIPFIVFSILTIKQYRNIK
jgi:hypothetical protein